MKTSGEWADEHWDVIAMLGACAVAVAVSLALGVAYNVAAARLEPSTTPPAVELSAPPARLERDDSPTPYS